MGTQTGGSSRPSAPRPRYRRITAAGMAALVTAVAVLGATEILPTSNTPEPVFAADDDAQPKVLTRQASSVQLTSTASTSLPRNLQAPKPPALDDDLPAGSGNGERVVFDIAAQRVWLVRQDNTVERTYLVSGSLTDNLEAGSYEVFSKSRDAVGIDDSGTMRYMVRFAQGTRAAIGFHDIPVHQGELVQTTAELGTPTSHGCIRQLRRDAKALWRFAPVGTKVVVLG